MRVYSRDDFMKLDPGAIFAKGERWAFGDLRVKGDTIVHDGRAIDFTYRDFSWVDSGGDGDDFGLLERMLMTGEGAPVNSDYARDGMFDDSEVFLVLEQDDLLQLRDAIDAALASMQPRPGE